MPVQELLLRKRLRAFFPATNVVERPSRRSVFDRALIVCVLFMVVIPPLLQTWILRNESGSDSIAYLDLAEAWARGDRIGLQNGFWSPLYPAAAGLVLRLVRPSSYWEIPVVHTFDFLIYVLAYVLFCYMLSGLRTWQHRYTISDGRSFLGTLEIWAIGSALFSWCSFRLITVPRSNPDMLVCATIFLAAGLLLRITAGRLSPWLFACFGAALGAGYLAKTPMLAIASVFLGSLVAVSRSAWRGPVLAGVSFALVAAPGVMLFSNAAGHLSVGESGGLNYAWHVNEIPRFHWRGSNAATPPIHTTSTLLDTPRIYEFSGRPGTYPIWFDPSYWNAGLKPTFALRAQLKVLASSVSTLFNLILIEQCGVALCITLLLASSKWRHMLRPASLVLVPVLASIGLFCLVHLEVRYIAGPLILFWVILFACVRIPAGSRLGIHASRVLVILLAIQLTAWTVGLVRTNGLALPQSNGADRPQWKVAQALAGLGIPSGSHVAFIHSQARHFGDYDWAFLAHVQITSEVTPGDANSFWSANSDRLRLSEALLRNSGIVAVVACEPPPSVAATWVRLDKSEYYVHVLNSTAAETGHPAL